MVSNDQKLKTVSVSEARAGFSQLVAAVENGEEFVITRNGKPIARLVAAESPSKEQRPPQRSLADVLMAFPDGIEFERDTTPMRDVDLSSIES